MYNFELARFFIELLRIRLISLLFFFFFGFCIIDVNHVHTSFQNSVNKFKQNTEKKTDNKTKNAFQVFNFMGFLQSN